MLRVLDELLWVLRREGLPVSTAQAIDAARVAALVGFSDRQTLRDGLGSVLATKKDELTLFRACFDRFFAEERAHLGDLWSRLRVRGFSDAELAALRELLSAAAQRSSGDAAGMLAFTGEALELDQLLASAGIARALAPMTSALQTGFFTQEVNKRLGIPALGSALARMRDALREALGEERGAALAAALREELDAMKRRVRAHVEVSLARKLGEADEQAARAVDRPFSSLSPEEMAEVRRALRRLAERLRGAERVRTKRSRRGRIDPHRTLRRSLRTGGIPFRPARRVRRRDKPRLVLLCDVSDSVRLASRFMLEFVAASQELFAETRSFVFVSDVGETTDLFRRKSPEAALAAIESGRVVDRTRNSNYGRALVSFEEQLGRAVDRRTTIVILGDGRTNFLPEEVSVVERLVRCAGSVLWICPEPPATWGTGDSAMPRYAAVVSRVLVARTARELEGAARELLARRK
ncbi:VWA domain-containing protein [Polyangium sp. y55x31]|uniref:VWA domain-containing protein n=1 Tax=Polyangium sp. y55x31 TaxID=3042688 RepID=UPI00248279FF|nr:VWA domain-containing protein [Polyangium sp. y55x31]MDI1482361.1 VWA domain-containing protein [Polyangium sp. y55x31]